ncbi:cell division protein FtsI (penicillin-binding protein 3) [Lentzea xinjiangensis]|uniref:Cell division protein FtsI (Penicillin-binding protein 3) n=1 Tax=Lentzea xinjiangensis TaxID=402600 RepID=A0A1H9GS87_9PSEU|nr:penicillin-binding protein 2 [Lentzea xinjiangensis]SEQ52848.1 cell division protein FtsI (penicillin-binding protein 3) [Lentzea xinjiangensis]
MPGPQNRAPRRPLSVRGPRPAARIGDNSRLRIAVGRILLIGALLIAGVKLVQVQGIQAEELSAQAQKQRTTRQNIPAERGSILDRNGNQLAFSIEVRALYILPQRARKTWDDARAKDPEKYPLSYEDHSREVARFISSTLGPEVNGEKTDEESVYQQLVKDISYEVLVSEAEPEKAAKIVAKYPAEIGSEYRSKRIYPNGDLASNIIGAANWRQDEKPPTTQGILGLENAQDNVLAGRMGRRVVDTMSGDDTLVIPNTERELVKPAPGKSLELTIDIDTQYAVQRMVTDYAAKSGAKNASAVVLDSRTGEIVAMANDKTYDPTEFGKASEDQKRNGAVSSLFEPGSVNKIVTAAAAVEYGLFKPDDVLSVPGSIKVADRIIRDAWNHPTVPMSFTGVFAKSSNVGTLLAAQEVGKERYAEMLQKFGLGKRTQSGVPAEEAGVVPPLGQWSGSTFGNLPIGQGLSMTLLQMTGMYQAIANDGLRIPPRLVRAEIGEEGARSEKQRPEGVRVVSPETAKTVRDMFRSVTQSDPRDPNQSGTGRQAALPGYQIAGKTGTAQQIDQTCKCYSQSQYWITFAGILPADNPRYVVGIMLDAPSGTPFSTSAAPLFHDIATFLTQRFQIPLSTEQTPYVQLQK